MRNLVALAARPHALSFAESSTAAARRLEAVAVDGESGRLFSASSLPDGALTNFQIHLHPRAHVPHHADAHVARELGVPANARLLCAFAAPTAPGGPSRSAVVSLQFLPDGGPSGEAAIVVLTAGGDIGLLSLPDTEEDQGFGSAPPTPEIVGSVEQGILAAAWSPDEESLVLITARSADEGEKVLVMSRDWEVLSESLLDTQDLGTDTFVNVGWGSAKTQFHGKAGKEAAAAAESTDPSASSARGPAVKEDDGVPRISWRSDSSHFAISSLSSGGVTSGRAVRIFAREGVLSATSEALRGMGHALSWKPNSLLMAATQRFDEDYVSGREGRHDVIFIEKNGLRHGEFSLREESGSQPAPGAFDAPSASSEQPWSREHAVRELSWNCDGSLLAVWLQRTAAASVVQIWSPTNYSWTLRSELPAPAGEICSVRWHPENALCLYIVLPDLIVERIWALQETVSPGDVPTDVACAAVVDGCSVRLTPLRTHNVPPPYAAFTLVPGLDQTRAIAHVAWADASTGSQAKSLLAVLFADAPEVAIYACTWGELGPRAPVGGWKAPSPQLLCTVNASASHKLARPFFAHQVGLAAVAGPGGELQLQLAVIGVHSLLDCAQAIQLIQLGVDADGKVSKDDRSLMTGALSRQHLPVCAAPAHAAEQEPRVLLQDDLGQIFAADTPHESLGALAEFCPYAATSPSLAMLKPEAEAEEEDRDDPSAVPRIVGLSGAGVLYVGSRVVARDATSFALSGDMLVWSSTAHQVRFLQLSAETLSHLGSGNEGTETLALSRRVERGSRIVAAVPSSMSLVLQMPRGNLETIYPRPLVLAVVRRNVADSNYAQAFLVCRTHRVDLNVLAQDEQFVSHLDEFVAQIGEAEHINLFLSSISAEASKTNAVCDSMRTALEQADAQRYVTCILTTYVRKQPPDYESALLLLRDIKGRDEAAADAACQYLIFLADADKLFDAALGLYDFVLPLLVAQHSPRRDPREYLAELRELRAISNTPYQRFRIDDRLARHAKAVTWLTQAGPDHHEEAIEYVLRHDLYKEAMAAWAKDAGKLREVQTLYGNWLLGKKRASEAANAYTMAGQTSLAIKAHKLDNQWREAFALALSPPRMGTQEVQLLAQELSMSLEEAARYEDAAQVALQYGRDVERAVDMLDRGGHFSEACRLCALHSRLDLVETHIKPAALETRSHLVDDIADMTSQVDRTIERLAALRVKKAEDPDSFYPDEDPIDDGRSDTATRITSFTRFTRFTRLTSLTSLASGPTALSSASSARTGMTAKRRKKEEKKKASGKKGSIYEEDYLFDSLGRLLGGKLEACQISTAALLPHLLQLSPAHQLAAHALTEALSAFETHAASAVAALSEAVATEHASIEALRLDALRSAVSQGSPFADLLAAGLFAPVPLREPIKVAQTKWRCEVLDAIADTKTQGAQ